MQVRIRCEFSVNISVMKQPNDLQSVPAKMPPKKTPVVMKTVSEFNDGQRIDNFLMRELKHLPKSRIYRLLRKGEVRVNKKRIKPGAKLSTGDIVRIPPIEQHHADDGKVSIPQHRLDQISSSILFEDGHIIIINKPANIPVHGGSGHDYGVIEMFRAYRPAMPYVELAHRLDKDTSGLLLLAKTKQALSGLHDLMREGGINKHYQTLVAGKWEYGVHHLTSMLSVDRDKYEKVQVSEHEGKKAESIFTPLESFAETTLLDVKILTGRMHQIRTQLAHLNHPVLGDSRYGDYALNREVGKKKGLKRLFLHAYKLDFILPVSGQSYDFTIPLASDLKSVLKQQ